MTNKYINIRDLSITLVITLIVVLSFQWSDNKLGFIRPNEDKGTFGDRDRLNQMEIISRI